MGILCLHWNSLRPSTPTDRPSGVVHSGSVLSSTGSGRTIPTPLVVILRVLPSQEGGPFGFIYLSVDKLNDQAAIIAYFENAHRAVTVLHCQDFDEFLFLDSLRTSQVSFIIDLPDYIVTMLGRRILEEGAHSDEVGWVQTRVQTSLGCHILLQFHCHRCCLGDDLPIRPLGPTMSRHGAQTSMHLATRLIVLIQMSPKLLTRQSSFPQWGV